MNGKYVKIRKIGKGTFGQVWLAEEINSRKKVALKEIEVKFDQNENEFLNEVKILSKLHHINVIKYKDAYLQSDGHHMANLHIVMEYAHQGDLSMKIKSQNGKLFDEKVVMNYFVQISFGLMYIHSQNIIHRDLKTQNILISGNNVLKIGDFGISKVLSGTNDFAHTAIGTPYYLAPEICNQKPYTFSSDLWSLGCVLFEISSLKRPFDGKNIQLLMKKIINEKYNPLPSNCSPLAKHLVEVLLRKNPDKRPSSRQLLKISILKNHVDDYVKFYNEIASDYKKSMESRLSFKCRYRLTTYQDRRMSEPTVQKQTDNKLKNQRRYSSCLNSTYFLQQEHKNENLRAENTTCKKCSLQSEWNKRIFGNIHQEYEHSYERLVTKFGRKSFISAVEFLTTIWDQENSEPVTKLIDILGKSNLDYFPEVIKFVALKKQLA